MEAGYQSTQGLQKNNILAQSTSAVQKADVSIQSTTDSRIVDVCTQSTTALQNMDASTQSSKGIILDAHLLAASPPERFLYANIISPNARQDTFLQPGRSNDDYLGMTSPALKPSNEKLSVAMICTDQVYSSLVHKERSPSVLEIQEQTTLKMNTSPMYALVELPQYGAFSAPSEWSGGHAKCMGQTAVAPPSYAECVETGSAVVDTPRGYRSFQPQAQFILEKERGDHFSLKPTSRQQREPMVQPVVGNGSFEIQEKSDYQALAFISCLFCWPVGLVAIYYSNMCSIEKSLGNYNQANVYSKLTFNASMAALASGILGYFFICVYESMTML
ncbi:hypothetical protein BgiMline_014507 [Biomphalaria glabrata]|nr:hypothetical protein BgiMline_013266 [Biomphalaria glabrata]KAI8773445.1 hypothetical protein BgiBS90_025863 [Biomphalaria glabrata]